MSWSLSLCRLEVFIMSTKVLVGEQESPLSIIVLALVVFSQYCAFDVFVCGSANVNLFNCI